ncbi:MAG: DUF4838 domain-containing protein [Opitutaceae bacterium]
MKILYRILLWPMLVVWLSPGASFNASAALTLVENGVAKADVVLSPHATPDEKTAAEELVHYIEKSTGVRLAVRRTHASARKKSRAAVLIGLSLAPEAVRARLVELDGEGFVIEADGEAVVLVGKGRHGTSFAVYEFLEQFVGVRWLWPGEVGEVVPRRDSLVVDDVVLVEEPAFHWRSLGPGGALWGPFDRWKKEIELGISEEHQSAMRLWERRNRFGGENIHGGHAFGEILPPGIYGPEHPEYYALINGRRDWENFDGKHRAQLCTTNPEVVQKVIEYGRLMFDRRPELDGFSIGANDGRAYCECDECTRLDGGRRLDEEADPERGRADRTRIITDRMILFGNQVAEAISRTHPRKKVVQYAYGQSKPPPERTKAHPNLLVLYTVNCNGFWNDDAREKAFEDFADWTRAAPTFGVYEYLTQTNFPDMPRLVPDLIRAELMELQRLGSRYYQTQAGNGFAVNGLNFYVLGRLLWDPSADVRAIQNDYVTKAFGSAAPAMNRYFDRLIESWRSMKSQPVRMNGATLGDYRDVLGVHPRELIDACRKDLEEAARQAGGEHKRRVEFVRAGFRYFEMTMDATEATYPLLQTGWHPGEGAPAIGRIEQRQIDRALDFWRKRDRYIEEHREDFVLSYLWVRSNNETRSFNPLERVNALQARGAALDSRSPAGEGGDPAASAAGHRSGTL